MFVFIPHLVNATIWEPINSTHSTPVTQLRMIENKFSRNWSEIISYVAQFKFVAESKSNAQRLSIVLVAADNTCVRLWKLVFTLFLSVFRFFVFSFFIFLEYLFIYSILSHFHFPLLNCCGRCVRDAFGIYWIGFHVCVSLCSVAWTQWQQKWNRRENQWRISIKLDVQKNIIFVINGLIYGVFGHE